MTLPDRYAWLAQEPGPRMLVEALKLFGTVEGPGTEDNPIILGWARELGLERAYDHDVVPWCGLFMALIAKRAGKAVPKQPLRALNWATWGEESDPVLGAVLVFKRDGGGHVAQYVGEDRDAFHCYGGNQSNAVTIRRVAKSRLHACRSFYEVGPPPNVRRIRLAIDGALSTNEA